MSMLAAATPVRPPGEARPGRRLRLLSAQLEYCQSLESNIGSLVRVEGNSVPAAFQQRFDMTSRLASAS